METGFHIARPNTWSLFARRAGWGVARPQTGAEWGNLLLWALVVLGSLWRFGLCLWRPPTAFLFSDPKRHWLNAERLFTPDLMGASDPILYQVYLHLVQRLAAGNPWLIAAGCGLLSVATAWVFYRAACALELPPAGALVFYAAATWLPSLAVIFHYFMTETLLLFLVAVGLWMSARHLHERTLASFLTAAAVWPLACLTKASVAPLAIVCLAYLWVTDSPRRLGRLAAAGMITAVLLIPGTLRTYRYLGFAAPLGSAWIPMIQHQSDATTIRIHWKDGLWKFSSPSCYVQPLEPLSAWMPARAYTDHTVDVYADPRHGEEDWRRARAALAESAWPQRWQRSVENILLLFFAPSWPDSNASFLEGRLNLWLRWIWGPLIFCVFWGNAGEFWQGRCELLPLATTAFTLFLLFQSSVTMEGRYRKPLEPLLLMNFIWLQSLPQRRSNER